MPEYQINLLNNLDDKEKIVYLYCIYLYNVKGIYPEINILNKIFNYDNEKIVYGLILKDYLKQGAKDSWLIPLT